jgi:hypothetical protein
MRSAKETYEEAMAYRIDYDRVERELPEGLTHEMLEELCSLARSKKREGVPRLRRLVNRYPEEPTLKNYLALAYEVRGDSMRAKWVRKNLWKQHPDYFFAKVAEATRRYDDKRAAEMPEVLGESMELREALDTDRDPHISEWKNFQLLAGLWHLDAGRIGHAEMLQRALWETEDAEEAAKVLSQHLISTRFEKMRERMECDKKRRIAVEGPPEPEFRERTPRPTVDPAVAALCEWDDELPEEVVDAVREMPREIAVRDLKALVRNAIDNAEHHYHLDCEYEATEYWIGIHALFLLGEVGGAEGRAELLEFLSLNEEVLRSILLEEFTWEPLVAFLEGDLDDVAGWLRRPGLAVIGRIYMVEALGKQAAARPERREAVLEVLMGLAETLVAGEPGDGVLDTRLVAMLLGELVELRVRDAEPLIRRFAELDRIEEMSCGSAEEMIAELDDPAPPAPELRTMPKWYWAASAGPVPEPPDELLPGDFLPLPEGMEGVEEWKGFQGEGGFEQRVVAEPGPGRNDPCPCGSGRKYKKCCMS